MPQSSEQPAKDANSTANSPSAPPSISLPKGGGAVTGIGEKFAANPVTGTGSLSVPFPLSPGRGGFGPSLALSYDSGSGNGPFGFGWGMDLPGITRRTDKGLPRYRDDEESDVFVLSGAEDLVPILGEDGQRHAEIRGQFRVERYRPRMEGLFARIERWTHTTTGRAHWRSISRDNVTTFYGRSDDSRIADPADPQRVFSWLICESADALGNRIVYEYVPEDARGIDHASPEERHRLKAAGFAQRYLKRVQYGNDRPSTLEPESPWLFELVLDYGDHSAAIPAPLPDVDWPARPDPFSTCRAGFEVRTYRRCARVLMFHRFPELSPEPTLVRSLEIGYSQDPAALYSFINELLISGHRQDGNRTVTRSMPALNLGYSQATIDETVRTLDASSLENLPTGLDAKMYQWIDLDGDGLPGVLTEQAGAWSFRRNLSPASGTAHLAPLELVSLQPSAGLAQGGQFMDLAGDGRPDLVTFGGSTPGYFEHREDGSWEPHHTFRQLPNVDFADPNLKFLDLSGDGLADLLLSEDEVFIYYASEGKDGFATAEWVRRLRDEERGPAIVFADLDQSVYVADMTGDGLADIVRLRNGQVCYWPNLGYGRFGEKVTMGGSPRLDRDDLFDQHRVRLADIDGSGTTDLIYLAADGPRLYFNRSGNAWSPPRRLATFPPVDDLATVNVLDLLGTGTACLVWSSSLPGDAGRQLRYLSLMVEKPHLLVTVTNNLGARTNVKYAPSTKFFVQDRLEGHPWITTLPFPVHVVERVETFDLVSRNRSVSRYAYHHGHFDGPEREFRGFGRVDQWDTEEIGLLETGDVPGGAVNLERASFEPPVYTRTWVHTGAFVDGERISHLYAHEYFGSPSPTHASQEPAFAAFERTLLPDTLLPAGLNPQEAREASRALRGEVLRQEVYALDGTSRAGLPYSVSERNYTVKQLQPLGSNRHAVYFTHARETIDAHLERNPADPRVTHSLLLDVDAFGNPVRSAAIGYGRATSELTGTDRQHKQTQTLATLEERGYTNAIDTPDQYRTPLPSEARSYELGGAFLSGARLTFQAVLQDADAAEALPYTDTIDPAGPSPQKRLIEHTRSLYRKDDLSGPLPAGVLESLALPFESHKLAFTTVLLESIYRQNPDSPPLVTDAMLAGEGGYVQGWEPGQWWLPSGRVLHSRGPADTPAQELLEAQAHFFLPRQYRDPFGHSSFVDYDVHDLLVTKTEDAVQNTAQAELDYRVLQPRLITDANGNRSQVAFDALGLVVGTAVMGKATEQQGDRLDSIFEIDLEPAEIQAFFDAASDATAQQPTAAALLGAATTRIVYDLGRFVRLGQPAFAATLARETHVSDLGPSDDPRVQVGFSYSDGFGREIQKKIQAEPGPLSGLESDTTVSPRWVGNGWVVFNNKGRPVRQFEPFFDDTHEFRFGQRVGVSSTLFYDPLGRVIATLHPNHTYEKVVFDPWKQTSFDVNDTVLLDPATDGDVQAWFTRLVPTEYGPTWHATRITGARGATEQQTAQQTEAHADTPGVSHSDALGRAFLTVAHNRTDGVDGFQTTQVELDTEGNQRSVTDALGRVVMRYDFDMLGRQVRHDSMEAGTRWVLPDIAGTPVRAWDSRGFARRFTFDDARRPLEHFLRASGETSETLSERSVYGEAQGAASNHRGRVFQVFDAAGIVTSVTFDYKGNLLASSRQFTRDYKTAPDWSQNPALENETFRSRTTYDALNRPVQQVAPHSDQTDAKLNVLQPRFNEANLLEAVDVWLGQGAEPNGLLEVNTADLRAITNLNHDAKGQRTRIDYGNGVTTRYTFDPETFRLTRLETRRGAGFPGDPPGQLQNLSYTYDPAGNIAHIQDDAQQTIFYDNQVVTPSADYRYDAIYRLIEATGREHRAQAGEPQHPTWDDAPRTDLQHPRDGQAMRTYTEQYSYDSVGNFKETRHRADGGDWTRTYAYAETSLLEPARQSNRLSSSTVAGITEPYTYDAHGNMTSMAHLPQMNWNFKDQLETVDLQGGGRAYYVYDAGGQRVRKVVERTGANHAVTQVNERLYLGGFEVYREQDASRTTVSLERETLHVMDDKSRIALVETRTQGNDGSPGQLIRYQLGNHLGSSSVELDEQARIISYEEYYSYGSTSYQAGQSGVEVKLKRYRYTGMERDEETGLAYHGARYYAPPLGRWANCDPIGIKGGINLFEYTGCRPINTFDTSGKDPEVKPEIQSRDGVYFATIPLNSTPYLIDRKPSETFTDAAKRLDSSSLTNIAINTELYDGRYSNSPTDPSDNPSEGLVIVSKTALSGSQTSPETFFFSNDLNGNWKFGKGDPPNSSQIAFGGGIPVIVNGLPYGIDNKYKDGAPNGLPSNGDPGSGNEKWLLYRSNKGFEGMYRQKHGGFSNEKGGLTVMGIDKETNRLIIIVKPNDSTSSWRITDIREYLIKEGVENAIAWDGSTSSTLVVDKHVFSQPSSKKDNTIPFGLGFRFAKSKDIDNYVKNFEQQRDNEIKNFQSKPEKTWTGHMQ